MPELPEVETMVRGLRPALEGRTLRAICVDDPHLLQGCTAEEIGRRGDGAKVRSVGRRGKWVVVRLDGDNGTIVIQPRMTGGFSLVEPDRPAHVRLTFHVERPDQKIWYVDARRLGKIAWHADDAGAALAFGRSHGPDALEIGAAELAERFAKTARGIKPTLLDQKVLAGIGNIYADEILHKAGVHPERVARDLTAGEVGRIHAAIVPILEAAIASAGSSFDRHYKTVLGVEGGYLSQSRVHRRKGLACPACGGVILKTKIAGLIGRPTYLCPVCQPAGGGEEDPHPSPLPGHREGG